MKIPISKPNLDEEEKNAVQDVLNSGFLAQGKRVAQFEEEFGKYIGVSQAIATSSGTAALFIALKALGISPNDIVITTPFTFVATASSIMHCGAIPTFCDINPQTFNIDPNALERVLKKDRNSIKAILIVHLYGLPCPMEEIIALADQYGIPVIEDCAQAHGAEYRGKKVGSFGRASAFSFYPTKNMTTGEGGMILTNDEEFGKKCRMLINHGSKKRYYHEFLGYNFRMTDIAAAIGRVQLRKLDDSNQKRRENAIFYNRELSSLPEIETPVVPDYVLPVFHQYTIKLKHHRDDLARFFDQKEIGYGIYYPVPLHQQKFIHKIVGNGNYPMADACSREVFSIPVHPLLKKEELEHVVDLIKLFCQGGFN
ncbi:DegT/DnrJ/EryC1/StrS family aminotransferase [Atribacter laminatus]|jgi:perosamine synthetase|uniref:GDP-perosamine synthase n=1 Tax=Atribacter laminatus TaxID=2847778 RepID=A0A7T1ANZ2_ATRLM|nr:DegT/DnrJ/EryC1/StrS family aminotransferase [Atribacter laminatus]QPM69412.1 GDP-perosamine synthase [Atribacter laminatus]